MPWRGVKNHLVGLQYHAEIVKAYIETDGRLVLNSIYLAMSWPRATERSAVGFQKHSQVC